MKTLIYACFVLIYATGYGQQLPLVDGKLGGVLPLNTDGNISYEQVIQAPDMNRAALFSRLRGCIAKTYKSANDVIQVSDATSGELLAKGNFLIQPRMMGMVVPTRIDHTLRVEVKDGRFRVTVDQFFMDARTVRCNLESIRGTSKSYVKQMYEMTDERILALIAGLTKAATVADADF